MKWTSKSEVFLFALNLQSAAERLNLMTYQIPKWRKKDFFEMCIESNLDILSIVEVTSALKKCL